MLEKMRDKNLQNWLNCAAYDIIYCGAKRLDRDNISIYKCGDIIRIDIKPSEDEKK